MRIMVVDEKMRNKNGCLGVISWFDEYENNNCLCNVLIK